MNRARELVSQLGKLWSRVDPRYAMMSVMAKRILIDGMSGETTRLDEDYAASRRATARYALPRPYVCALAVRRFEAGHPEDARDDFEFLSRNEYADLPHDATYVVTLVQLALLAHDLDDRARAGMLIEKLDPFAGRYASGHTTALRGVVDRYRAMLAWTMGDLDRAERLFGDAIEQERRMRAPPWEALARMDRARLWLERGGRSRRAEAIAELDAADALCRPLEVEGVRGMIAAVRRTVGGLQERRQDAPK